MYLPPESVRRRLLRRYRRRSWDVVVDERLRGWAWEVSPISPPYDCQLPLAELVSRECSTMRDIYLRHVERKKRAMTIRMIENVLYHSVVATVVQYARSVLYQSGAITSTELRLKLNDLRDEALHTILKGAALPRATRQGRDCDRSRMRMNMTWLYNHEVNEIVTALDRVISAQPQIGRDALVTAAIPLLVEQKLDGHIIGLSGQLSADAYGAEGAVLDIKTDAKRRFHRLSTTGCAMVVESMYEYPVDVGCTVYCWFNSQIPPTIEYDIHQIDGPLRLEFLQLRNQAMKLISDQTDPGVAPVCYEDCPYWDECH